MSFNLFTSDAAQLAVVPIVVNAGAALLPAILAAATTFLALLLKPRELIRACKARPAIPVIILLLVACAWTVVKLATSFGTETESKGRAGRTQPGAAAGSAGVVSIDWTRIALARIEARQNAPLAASAVAAQAPAPESQAGTEQPFIFRGGLDRRGLIGSPVQGGLRKAWHHYPRWLDENGAEQQDTEAMILSSPAFHGGRVFGASCLLDPPDSFGVLFALDAATGRQLWTLDKVEGRELKGFFSSPAVTADGRYVIVGQGLHPDTNCRLLCVDAATGRLVWSVQTPLHLESSPAIEGDVVYIGAGAIEDPATHKPISHIGYVLAVRISDGKELWRHDVADPESSPAVKDGVLYIGSGFNGNAIVALRAGTDEELKQRGETRELWRVATPYPITGAVTLLGDMVIAGGGNGDFVFRDPKPAGLVMAIDRRTGNTLWRADMPDAVLGAVAAGKYLICPVASGEVVALQQSDGKRVWTSRVSGNAPVLAAPAVTDSEVFAVSQDGYLARFDLETGALKEKAYINATDRPGAQGLSISSPLIVNGRLYVGSETGGFRCYTGGGQ